MRFPIRVALSAALLTIVAHSALAMGAPPNDRDHYRSDRDQDRGDHGHVHGVPGPIVGAGLPILAIGYGAYWLVRRRRCKAAEKNSTDRASGHL